MAEKEFLMENKLILITNPGSSSRKYALYKGNDEIGKLMHDFHAKSSDDMNFKELAEGVHHFKETEEGRDVMCESVKNYAIKYGEELVEQNKIDSVKLIMKNMKCTLDEDLNTLEIKGNERKIISQQLQR